MALPAARDLHIKRNTALLSAALAANSGMLQLSAAVASLTFVLVTGVKGLLGLGPALVLASGALAALPAGRAMDRFGRVPVLASGFAIGAFGGCLAALGSALETPVPVFRGGREASRSSWQGRSLARSSGRPSSARSSRAGTWTATRSPSSGWPGQPSWSSALPSSSSSGLTRSGSRRPSRSGRRMGPRLGRC